MSSYIVNIQILLWCNCPNVLNIWCWFGNTIILICGIIFYLCSTRELFCELVQEHYYFDLWYNFLPVLNSGTLPWWTDNLMCHFDLWYNHLLFDACMGTLSLDEAFYCTIIHLYFETCSGAEVVVCLLSAMVNWQKISLSLWLIVLLCTQLFKLVLEHYHHFEQ